MHRAGIVQKNAAENALGVKAAESAFNCTETRTLPESPRTLSEAHKVLPRVYDKEETKFKFSKRLRVASTSADLRSKSCGKR
jgi:hypothetical protein